MTTGTSGRIRRVTRTRRTRRARKARRSLIDLDSGLGGRDRIKIECEKETFIHFTLTPNSTKVHLSVWVASCDSQAIRQIKKQPKIGWVTIKIIYYWCTSKWIVWLCVSTCEKEGEGERERERERAKERENKWPVTHSTTGSGNGGSEGAISFIGLRSKLICWQWP